MELKTKYQYTYFIYPFAIKETKYTRYLLKLLKDENCKLKIFRKDKDLDIYTYFTHRVRNYMFNTFNWNKTKLARFEELPLDTRSAILAKNHCTIFEYTIKNDIQGKTEEKNGIFFKIPKIEIICFNTGICFLCIKTNIEDSYRFADILNFNYKFRDINQEFANLNNYDNIKVQTDCFEDVKNFRNFIEDLTGPNTESIKLEIDTERFLTYSYVCVDQESWNNNNEFENISSTYIKFLNILPNDNNVNYDKENIRVISKWKYAKLGITKQGITLFSSSYEMNNYTVLPKEFEEQYLYTYIMAIYTKIYLRKINLEFRQGTNINKTRNEFIKFTKELWINEVTLDDTGSLFYQYLKDVLELKTTYYDTKNKYDILYKEMNIEKSAKNNMVIVLLLLTALILNIMNIWFLPK